MSGTRPVSTLFVQFLNAQMLKNSGIEVEHLNMNGFRQSIVEMIKLLELIGIERLVIPTITLSESPLYDTISSLPAFQHLLRHSRIIFSGSGTSTDEWVRNKKQHYKQSQLFTVYFEKQLIKRLSSYEPYFQKRLRSSTRDVARGWVRLIGTALSDSPTDVSLIKKLRETILTLQVFRSDSARERLLSAPLNLGSQAFVWEIIKQQNLVGLDARFYEEIEEVVQNLLSYIWLDSHCDEYRARIFINLPYLGRMDCGYSDDHPEHCVDYLRLRSRLMQFGLVDFIAPLNIDEVAVLGVSEQWSRFSTYVDLAGNSAPIDGFAMVDIEDILKRSKDATAAATKASRAIEAIGRCVDRLETGTMKSIHPLGELKMSRRTSSLNDGCVVLATANRRELEAVVHFLKETSGADPEFKAGGSLPHWSCEVKLRNSVIVLAAMQADDTGSTAATDLVDRILTELTPSMIFFVGCAALLDEKQPVKPNSVYVARSALDSDKVEVTDLKDYYSMDRFRPDSHFRRVVEQMNVDGLFGKINLETRRDFISGSAFMAGKNSPRRKALVADFPKDAVVLDMEAFAALQKQFLLRERHVEIAINVVKGISDVGDDQATVNKDENQKIATLNALSVIRAFLEAVAE